MVSTYRLSCMSTYCVSSCSCTRHFWWLANRCCLSARIRECICVQFANIDGALIDNASTIPWFIKMSAHYMFVWTSCSANRYNEFECTSAITLRKTVATFCYYYSFCGNVAQSTCKSNTLAKIAVGVELKVSVGSAYFSFLMEVQRKNTVLAFVVLNCTLWSAYLLQSGIGWKWTRLMTCNRASVAVILARLMTNLPSVDVTYSSPLKNAWVSFYFSLFGY